jgi:riboflavin kinase/FMN adenylyltransferase
MTQLVKLEEVLLDQPSIVTIGVFDGVHRGHQEVLKALIAEAQQSQRKAVVVTFFPHPDELFKGVTGRYYLTTIEERAHLMRKLGVDTVVTLRFDDEFSRIRANVFVDQLINNLKMASLWVGADFALGYKREGNVEFLKRGGIARGYTVNPITLVTQASDGSIINSTAIREQLLNGHVEKANEWLGRPYAVSGEVVQGDKRGRTIGFPTANTAVWEQQVIPGNGVYAGWATLGERRYKAVTNIGTRPTFDGVAVRVEPHLLDFDEDIYGQTLTISFEHRLRDEQKFDGIEALKKQLAADVAKGRKLLKSR